MNKPNKTGREVLVRVMAALLAADDCYIPYRGAQPIGADGVANWEARQTISKLLREGSVIVPCRECGAGECTDCTLERLGVPSVESLPAVEAADTWTAIKDWTAEGSPIVDGNGQGGLF